VRAILVSCVLVHAVVLASAQSSSLVETGTMVRRNPPMAPSFPEDEAAMSEPRFVEERASTRLMQPVIIAGGGISTPDPMPPMPIMSRIATIVAEPGANIDEDSDPAMLKLNQALEAVKEHIMGNNKQINDEGKWLEAVEKITEAYQEKMGRVTEHVRMLRHDQRQLFEKKKQIENLRLQHRLEKKLTEANDEMSALRGTLDKVQKKSHELHQSHNSLQQTIVDIQGQIDKLQGQEPDPSGDASAGAAGGSADAAGGGEETLAQ